MTPEQKFNDLEKDFKRLSNEMCRVVGAFYLWRALVFARSITEVGQEQAERNVKIMSIFRHFFLQAEDSLLETCIVSISKFYDKNKDALSFNRLVKKLRKYSPVINESVFNIVRPDLSAIRDTSDYVCFHEDDIAFIETLRANKQVVISNLKTIRDQQFAHLGNAPIQTSFVPNDVESLIIATQEMFNKLTNRFDMSSTHWGHWKDDAERNAKLLLEDLVRGEARRLEEIEARWRTNQ